MILILKEFLYVQIQVRSRWLRTCLNASKSSTGEAKDEFFLYKKRKYILKFVSYKIVINILIRQRRNRRRT